MITFHSNPRVINYRAPRSPQDGERVYAVHMYGENKFVLREYVWQNDNPTHLMIMENWAVFSGDADGKMCAEYFLKFFRDVYAYEAAKKGVFLWKEKAHENKFLAKLMYLRFRFSYIRKWEKMLSGDIPMYIKLSDGHVYSIMAKHKIVNN